MEYNYNVSDDADEYSDTSIKEFTKDFKTTEPMEEIKDTQSNSLIVKNNTSEVTSMEVEHETNDPIGNTSVSNDFKQDVKEAVDFMVRQWFPNNKKIYNMSNIRTHMNITETKDDGDIIESNKTNESNMSAEDIYVEYVSQKLNAMAHEIGEMGVHCLLQNKDYKNGYNEFKSFINDIIRSSDGHDVNFYIGNSTNYPELTYDGNFDSLSMKMMGYFSIGASKSSYQNSTDLQRYEFPDESTWLRTIKNAGFAHVDVIPVEYDLLDMSMKPEKLNRKQHDEDVWICDPDYVESCNTQSSGADLVIPKSILGSKKVTVYIKQQRNITGNTKKDIPTKERLFRMDISTGKNHTRLYKIIVNFIGQSKNPAWWNTKSKYEIAEMNLSHDLNELLNVQKKVDAYATHVLPSVESRLQNNISDSRLENICKTSTLENVLQNNSRYDISEKKEKEKEKIPIMAPSITVEKNTVVVYPKKKQTSIQYFSPKSSELEKQHVKYDTKEEEKKLKKKRDRKNRREEKKAKKEKKNMLPQKRSIQIECLEEFIHLTMKSLSWNTKLMDYFMKLSVKDGADVYISYFDHVLSQMLKVKKSCVTHSPFEMSVANQLFNTHFLPNITKVDLKLSKITFKTQLDANGSLQNVRTDENRNEIKYVCAVTGEKITGNVAFILKCVELDTNGKIIGTLSALFISQDHNVLKSFVSFVDSALFLKEMHLSLLGGNLDEKYACRPNSKYVKQLSNMLVFKDHIDKMIK